MDGDDDVDDTVASEHGVEELGRCCPVGEITALDGELVAGVAGTPRHLEVVGRPARSHDRRSECFEARRHGVGDADRTRDTGDEGHPAV